MVFDFLVNLSDQLPLPPISLTAALMRSKKITSLSLTNKPASDSSPSASCKNDPISYMRMFSFIYQPTTQIHLGKNGTAHLPPTLTPSSKHSSAHNSQLRTLPRTYPNIPSSSVNWAYKLAVLVSSAPVHVLTQTLSLLWRPPAEMLFMASKSTSTSPTSPFTKPSARYLTSPRATPPKSYNASTVSSPTLQKSPAPHPFLPQIASTTSSRLSLLRAPAADSNST